MLSLFESSKLLSLHFLWTKSFDLDSNYYSYSI